MDAEQFNAILAKSLHRSETVLEAKSDEYASEKDRLHNFKTAGALQGIRPEQALLGMWAKHVVSICDMVQKAPAHAYSEAQWEEKIGDTINYMILLEALVYEVLSTKKKEIENAKAR